MTVRAVKHTMSDVRTVTAPISPYLAVRQVHKTFGRFQALAGISCEAWPAEFLCILGPSGCGKTTLLRVVAGLEPQDVGEVVLNGRDVSRLPVSARNVGIVFQSYALFPNLTAGQNIGYGLRGRRDRGEIRKRVGDLLKLVGLHELAEKYPAQLSGGQQQRVALARAMALSPDLLLLDEPLSALDAQVRITLRSELRQLQRRLGVTTLMVTHDQEEALTMADRILVMDQGVIVQEGTPQDIYQKPATPFVAAFIGSMNFLHGAVKEAADTYRAGPLQLRVRNGTGALPAGSRVTIAIRPEDVRLGATEETDANTFAGRILGLEFRGPLSRLTVRLAGNGEAPPPLQVDLPSETVRRLGFRQEADVPVHLPLDRIRVYPS
jgi:iron(III) transport system ATP-binding protein